MSRDPITALMAAIVAYETAAGVTVFASKYNEERPMTGETLPTLVAFVEDTATLPDNMQCPLTVTMTHRVVCSVYAATGANKDTYLSFLQSAFDPTYLAAQLTGFAGRSDLVEQKAGRTEDLRRGPQADDTATDLGYFAYVFQFDLHQHCHRNPVWSN